MKRGRKDNEGWRRGNGAYGDNSAGLVRGSGWGDTSDIGSKKGVGKYQDKIADFLTQKPTGAGTGDTHDIYNDVCRNSLDDDAGGSRPGPVKYGID